MSTFSFTRPLLTAVPRRLSQHQHGLKDGPSSVLSASPVLSSPLLSSPLLSSALLSSLFSALLRCSLRLLPLSMSSTAPSASLFRPSPVKLSAWSHRAYACVDKLDAAGFSACFSSDIWMRFANQPPLTGRDNAHAAFHTFFQRLKSLTHEMLREWRDDDTPDGDGTALLLESSVTYITDNGGTCTVPATTSWRLRVEEDGVERAHWVQICVDLAPLFALLALPPDSSTDTSTATTTTTTTAADESKQ